MKNMNRFKDKSKEWMGEKLGEGAELLERYRQLTRIHILGTDDFLKAVRNGQGRQDENSQ